MNPDISQVWDDRQTWAQLRPDDTKREHRPPKLEDHNQGQPQVPSSPSSTDSPQTWAHTQIGHNPRFRHLLYWTPNPNLGTPWPWGTTRL